MTTNGPRRQSWYPGFHGLTLEPKAAAALTTIADVMIPGDGTYPTASEAGIVRFVADHISPGELDLLMSVLARVPVDGTDETRARWLGDLETAEAASFQLLRWHVYTGYYASPLVVAAMNRRGFDYHGPPQPFGYQIATEQPIPRHSRGSYVVDSELRQ